MGTKKIAVLVTMPSESFQFVCHHYDHYYFCFHLYHFLECPDITFKNSWYIISVKRFSWHWNRNKCQSQGGDLVSIETEEEWNFINDEIQRRNMTKKDNRWSIGLIKKAGNWTWVSERPLNICKWGQGEPSGEHDVAFMYNLDSNGVVFGTLECTSWKSRHACICEISKGELIFVVVVVNVSSKLKGTRSA